jgi:UDP-glucose 4-epimerase
MSMNENRNRDRNRKEGKFLVTGGAGFIGSHIASRLVEEGYETIVLDDLSLGKPENVPKGARLLTYPCELALIPKDLYGLKGIFHLGMPSSSPMYRDRPGLAGLTIREFEVILRLAEREGCRLVYASTSSLYNGNPIPWHEGLPIYATDIYTETRYWMERLARVYAGLYGVESVGLRFFSVYGPGERHKGRFANMISQMLWSLKRGEEIVLYGDGSQTRDFVWVEDVAEACMKAMYADLPSESEGCEVLNVGYGKAYSFNEVLSMLSEALGIKPKVRYVENPIRNYVRHTLADTRKAERLLGFRASVSLKEGIERLVDSG